MRKLLTTLLGLLPLLAWADGTSKFQLAPELLQARETAIAAAKEASVAAHCLLLVNYEELKSGKPQELSNRWQKKYLQHATEAVKQVKVMIQFDKDAMGPDEAKEFVAWTEVLLWAPGQSLNTYAADFLRSQPESYCFEERNAM